MAKNTTYLYRKTAIFFYFFSVVKRFLLDESFFTRQYGSKWDEVGKSGMTLFTGEFKATLDEKGRISLPAHLRRLLNESELYITQSVDNCLWLHPASEYSELLRDIKDSTNRFSKKDRDIRRRFFNSHCVEIDKAGRIPIPQNYREIAGLSKECMILGQGEYIEVWDEGRYNQYLVDSDDEFNAASEELSDTLKRKRGIKD